MASLAPEVVISGLVKRGVPLHVAQGVVARLHGESRLDPGINEINPVVEGSRGGFGLAQWTGPRRKQLEEFAASRGQNVADPELQMDFLMWENANTEKGAWDKVMQAKDPVEAARLFTTEWERPGIPHLDNTIKTAQSYAGITPDYAGGAASGTYSPGQAPQPNPDNQLRQPQLNFSVAGNDVNNFLRQPTVAQYQPLMYERRNILGGI